MMMMIVIRFKRLINVGLICFDINYKILKEIIELNFYLVLLSLLVHCYIALSSFS